MISTLFKTVLTTVLGGLKIPVQFVISLAESRLFSLLSAVVSPAAKGGVAIGFTFIIVYLAVFHVETPIERTVLLASTIGSFVAGFLLGSKV